MTELQTNAESHGIGEGHEATSRRTGLHVLLSLLVLTVGLAAIVILIVFRKPPGRSEPEVAAPLVQVRKLTAGDVRIVVHGHGTVEPKVKVEIIPEVAGRVVFVHSELKAGGIIGANEKVVQIDPRDYELAVREAEAAVAEAQAGLDAEIAEADAVRREWRRRHPETEPDSPLALRELQIRRARAALESAKAQLAIAELHLERTVISLPFDVLVAGETVDLGQYIGVGQLLATAYGVDAFEIEVPLDDDDLAWFDVFSDPRSLTGGMDILQVPAEVHAEFAGARHTWSGHVTRTTGRVDPASRMVPVVVEVARPLDTSGGKPPLLPGAFVQVAIAGKTLSDAVAVPREAIHDPNRVWVVEEGELAIRSIEIVRSDEEYAYVVAGLSDGDLIVTGALDGPVEGMAVRTSDTSVAGVPKSTEAPSEPGGGGR
jgi:RND family efflux transporter MFP subunit